MKSEIFKKAHALAKATIKAGDNYQATFALCLKVVYADNQFTGSAKQIAWAKDIYAVKVKQIDQVIADVKARVAGVTLDAEEQAYIDRFLLVANAVRNCRKASFWIDNRSSDFTVGTSYIDGRIFDAAYTNGSL